ncbi:MAG TPA: TetR/AcrR family transcriptional regulator C-terminal domain-containing protein [Candidatus Binatia bacterium]|jgi:AcrR family transcriptional regulator|nr:TetR/AcrR family transcriptional regulator C-terminal domain-containing protein [Candidatus Binatia bacterium]
MAVVALSRDRVVTAGVAVARAAGMRAVGVRTVAGRLGVTPMAIYRHVPDGATVIADVAERIASVLVDVPRDGAWDDRFRRWATMSRAHLRRHPGFAQFAIGHWFEVPALLHTVERLLEVAEAAGFDGHDMVAAANLVFTYVLTRVELEESIRQAGTLRRRVGALHRSSDVGRLQAHLAEYRVARTDVHFAYGLDTVLAGLAWRAGSR